MRLLPLFLILLVTVGCGPSHEVRLGQRVFAGCDRLGVDDKATLKAGVFICKGEREDVFRGNGIACGDCHIPGDNFGMNPDRALPPDHILFTAALLDNDPALVQDHGLIRVITVGTLGPVNQDRQVPKLVHLRDLCDKHTGNCDGLGLLGDRVENLNVFTIEAAGNHMGKTIARVPGVDFVVPDKKILDAITAYQLSTLVADQNERR